MHFRFFWVKFAAPISKAAILGIALGSLVILLMILLAACRPYKPQPFSETSESKPGIIFLCSTCLLVYSFFEEPPLHGAVNLVFLVRVNNANWFLKDGTFHDNECHVIVWCTISHP